MDFVHHRLTVRHEFSISQGLIPGGPWAKIVPPILLSILDLHPSSLVILFFLFSSLSPPTNLTAVAEAAAGDPVLSDAAPLHHCHGHS